MIQITFAPVRIPALLLSLALFFGVSPRCIAQDPGAQQDAEAAREKLLKAEDELENIQANSETTKTSVDGMKTDVTTLQSDVAKLQADNAALRQQVADLQTALDAFKEEQIKARQTLIDNVAGMIAASVKTSKKSKETIEPATETTAGTHAPEPAATSLAPPPDAPPASVENVPATNKPQKGYYHTVASGETLKMICEAYRENGVKVTLSQIRKANGLTTDSVLKPGQKIFIPKPGPDL